MPRWDYDTVFYRVFCVTLLGLAFTFTVILTNVFIDIDGLLSKKNKAYEESLPTVEAEETDGKSTNVMPESDLYDFKDYGDTYDDERTKRSLEPQDFPNHIKDPKIKQVITDRLSTLLEDLDKEEYSKRKNKENDEIKNKLIYDYYKNGLGSLQNKEIENEDKIATKIYKDEEMFENKKSREEFYDVKIMEYIERIKKEKSKKQKFNHTEDELKHLAMHNIILQGIIGHMDLGDVYARVHALINDLENPEVHKEMKGLLHPEHEKQFFNELINCNILKEQIISETAKREMSQTIQKTTAKEIRKPTVQPTGRNVMIKTIIDINSLANDITNQDNVSSKENINGIIKIIYNGKSLRFRRVDDGITTMKPMVLRHSSGKLSEYLRVDSNVDIKDADDKNLDTDKSRHSDADVPKIYMNKIISEYLKRYSKESESLEDTKKIATKRFKRHVNILYENEETTTEKLGSKGKNEDDELFVEIETHFDSKGTKGEKKKKMIRDLIEKIQKAIHSKNEIKKKKHNRLHVKKRNQNPLVNENTAKIVKQFIMPLNNLVHRESDPISKSMPLYEKLPNVADGEGNYWRNYYHPRFLTVSKAINSAEMSELDTDYNKVMHNGIPERLQMPLNTDSINETLLKYNNVQDVSYANMLVKDISGSGFSIGFNQYIDEQPDEESIKLFTGIKNIIQTYHQKYDEEGTNTVTNENTNNENSANKGYSTNQEYPGPETDGHSIVRRSIKEMERDYHSNEYKMIFNKNFLIYDNYQDVYNSKGNLSIAKNSKTKKNPALVIDDNIFNKNLKPADIFSIAELLERKKRSLNVRRISDIRYKTKLNRYINTKSMASKKIFQQNKRSKRQIDKIRIIAKDFTKHHRHNSEEDIFASSDEKIFADRAIVKEVGMPYMETSEKINEHFDIITPPNHRRKKSQKVSEEHYDIISPQKVTDNYYDILSPYIFGPSSIESSYANNVFSRRSRQNALMSKYPHIFVEEIIKSKEDFSPLLYGKMIENFPAAEVTTTGAPEIDEMLEPQYMRESNLQNPYITHLANQPTPQEKSNYKVTVKIMPKNNTHLNSGFKEIHTSFNKSFNKNGLLYTSLVNVSEISKVEKIKKTEESNKTLQTGHLQMKSLIQQHNDKDDEQSAYLNKKKEKLVSIDNRNEKLLKYASKDYIDVALPSNPAQALRLTKDDLERFFNFHKTTTTELTTPILTTTEYVEPITENPDQIKLIKTIEKNDNITNEILKKIDKNTDVLQVFLDKLVSKMDELTPKTTQKPEVVHENPEPNINNERQMKTPNTQVLKTNRMYDQIPNMFFNQMAIENGSAGIPFIYAFQQPYNMMPDGNKKEVRIANVVYQGHIHANTVNTKPEQAIENTRKLERSNEPKQDWKTDDTKPAIKNLNNFKENNVTRFFIDDLDNEFIVGKTVYPGNMGNKTKV